MRRIESAKVISTLAVYSLVACLPISVAFAEPPNAQAVAAEIAYFKSNPSQFCDNAMALRFLRSREIIRLTSEADVDFALSHGQLKDLTDQVGNRYFGTILTDQRDRNLNPVWKWYLSLVPGETTRLAVANIISGDVEKINEPFSVTDERLHQLNLVEAVSMLDLKECSELGNRRRSKMSLNYEPDEIYGMSHLEVAKRAGCYEFLGLWRSNECSKSFDTVIRIAKPLAPLGLTGAEIYDQIDNDARYDEGLSRAAKLVAARIAKRAESESNLFADLENSFIASGASREDANEMAWNTIGVLAAGGSNPDIRIITKFNSEFKNMHKKLSLIILASSLPILDERSSKEGKLYSWPEGVSGKCNSGKSYHFWFTAFLARKAAFESGLAEASAVAAYQDNVRKRASPKGQPTGRHFYT